MIHFPGDFVIGLLLGMGLMFVLQPYIVPPASELLACLDEWVDRRRRRGRE